MDSKEYNEVLFHGKTYKSTDELAAIVGPKGKEIIVQDTLKNMFELQKEYQLKMGNGVMPRLDGKLVSDFALGLMAEIGEVLQEYKGWKSWRNSDYFTNNRENCSSELADCFHFFINFCLALGFDFEEIVQAFYKKHEENLGRIKYTCEDCDNLITDKCHIVGCLNMSKFRLAGDTNDNDSRGRVS